jgi:hypothetical protein
MKGDKPVIQFLTELAVVSMAWILPGLILGTRGKPLKKEGIERFQ